MLTPAYGSTPEKSIDAFFDSIVQDQQIIAIMTMPDQDGDVFITDDPDAPDLYAPPEEKTSFRYWSGRGIS